MSQINRKDFQPKRFGLKYDPPTITLEYQSNGKLFHHKIKLLKLQATDNSREVLDQIKNKHYMYFMDNRIKDYQILTLVEKLKQRMQTQKQLQSQNFSKKPQQFQNNFISEPTDENHSTINKKINNQQQQQQNDISPINQKDNLYNKQQNGNEKQSNSNKFQQQQSISSPVSNTSGNKRKISSGSGSSNGEKTYKQPKISNQNQQSSNKKGFDYDNNAGFDQIELEEEEEEYQDDNFESYRHTTNEDANNSPTQFKKNMWDDLDINDEEDLGQQQGQRIKTDGSDQIDYDNYDLNKLDKNELQKHKEKMDIEFKKNSKKPGDQGFEYDKRQEFNQNDLEDNEWDD